MLGRRSNQFVQKDGKSSRKSTSTFVRQLVATLSGSYCYRVDSIRVVSPEDIEVLDDSDGAILTLVTC